MKASDIKRGNVVAHNNQTYVVKAVERSSPTARGGNTTFRFSLYSVPGGQKLDLSLRADDELAEVDLTRRAATYSYKDGDAFVFLDAEDYTPWTLDPDVVGEMSGFLSEGLEGCWVQIVDDRAIGVQLPQSVVLEVVDTAPEMKGATATKRPKPAKLNTGIEIQVPEYVRVGERIHVNTDTGEFAGRE